MKEQFPKKEPRWEEPTEEDILKMLEDGLNLVRDMSDEQFLKVQEEMELKQMKVLERKELMNLQRREIEKIKNHAPAKKGAPAMNYLDLLKLEKLMPEQGSEN